MGERTSEPGYHRLTARQHEVLLLVARGHSSKEIGRKLGLSPKTVDRHVEKINERLGTDHRTASARLYMDWITASGEELPMGAEWLAPFTGSPQQPDEADEIIEAEKPNWFRLPPLGGERKHRSLADTSIDMLKVSAFGLIAVLGLLLLATGLMHYFR
jgi:DNA-binding CsgD family transcriptional regulator